MLSLKKSVLPLLALYSGAALAGTMGPVCTAENVTIPCTAGWEVSGAALYLQNLHEGLSSIGGRTASTGISSFDRNDNWTWGFMINAGYHFGHGQDFDVNWYHEDANWRTVLTDVLDRTTGTLIPGVTYKTHKPNWDAVNIEAGQLVDYGPVSHVRYYTGFEYVNLKLDKNLSAVELGGSGTVFQRNSQYNGYGARAGAKGWYGVLDNLAFYADGALGLTAGGSTYRSRSTDLSTGVVTGENVDASVVVPQLEAKLGGTFGYTMAQGTLSLDAGWMWINYFDPLIEVSHSDINYFNTGFQGPYVGLKWQGDLI